MDSGVSFHALYVTTTNSQRHKKRILIVIYFNPSRSFFCRDLFSGRLQQKNVALNQNKNTNIMLTEMLEIVLTPKILGPPEIGDPRLKRF